MQDSLSSSRKHCSIPALPFSKLAKNVCKPLGSNAIINPATIGDRYVPFDVDTSTLGGKIKLYRYLHGLSQEELALKLEVNKSTVFHYENNKHNPLRKHLKNLILYYIVTDFLIKNQAVYFALYRNKPGAVS